MARSWPDSLTVSRARDPLIRVLRGLLLGLFAFAGFFLVLALSIEPAGIARAFAAAIAAALILQGGALWALRRESPA